MTFRDYFRAASGQLPYPYQERFAASVELPHLLRVPTGAGKTATAVLAWLWRFRNGQAPRRLVYCLPMRVLVEQSKAEAQKWIDNLVSSELLEEKIKVHVLMGGVDLEDWHLRPDRPAILIGTQDMLLSRALNRGYAESRYHWPIDFGLLNSDCLWVFDEPQLMANGVSTSAQLAGLRNSLGTFSDCSSVWMSATLEPVWLETVDFRGKFTALPLELNANDFSDQYPLNKKMTAAKTLAKASAVSSKDMKDAAKAILKEHVVGTQTLAVVNTVDRAKALYCELQKLAKKTAGPPLLLVHSRFRPPDRRDLNAKLQQKPAGDRIVVATQVVEAGVDITSRTLFTELAPWAGVVQRLGRCNRTGGEDNDSPGRAFWLDVAAKDSAPYEEADLAASRGFLASLEGKDVAPKSLDTFKAEQRIELPFEHMHVLRRRDLLDLFDTAPDLSGNDIDIQRFVRSDDVDISASVFWRETLAADSPSPLRDELCSVPIKSLQTFVDKDKRNAWVWDHIDGKWKPTEPKTLRPGMTVMLQTTAGGYTKDLGWDPDSKATVEPVPHENTPPVEGADTETESETKFAYTIAEHTQQVCDVLEEFLGMLPHLAEHSHMLRTAARWHDLGKGHEAFQTGMREANEKLDTTKLWAKSGSKKRLRHGRPYFRHELVSALATLGDFPFLVSYMMAAHHGRVRLAIRSVPGEADGTVLGVCDTDTLDPIDIGNGIVSPPRGLSLNPMKLGDKHSWTASALALLQEHGPFRLAYLEAVLRAADAEASRRGDLP